MDLTKIRLSEEEMNLVCNASWILTKNQILEKVKRILVGLGERQKEIISSFDKGSIPAEVMMTNPKVSKGENYKGLPYLILDYPRYFKKENIFALRTMFWWGHYFSSTLHISGRYKKEYENALLSQYKSLQKTELYIAVNKNEWEHEMNEENYQLINNCAASKWHEIIQQNEFVKLAKKVSLKEWTQENSIEDLLAKDYLSLIAILMKKTA